MFKIQMKEHGTWWSLGGVYSQALADMRLGQFQNCYMSKGNCLREFRLIAVAQ